MLRLSSTPRITSGAVMVPSGVICACRIAALAVDEFHHGSVAARKMGLLVDRLEQESLYVDRPVVGADRAVGDDHALLSADI